MGRKRRMSEIKTAKWIGDLGPEAKRKYTAPSLQRLTPEQIKSKFSLHADITDSQVRRVLECIEQIERRNPS